MLFGPQRTRCTPTAEALFDPRGRKRLNFVLITPVDHNGFLWRLVQGTIIDIFVWRQFKRFNIREDSLPPGSIVRFKTYSFWELYRGYFVATLFLILLQSGLISFLLWQRAQHQRAEEQLAGRIRFEKMLSALSARFVDLPLDRLDAEIERVLESIGKTFDLDRVGVFGLSEEGQRLRLL